MTAHKDINLDFISDTLPQHPTISEPLSLLPSLSIHRYNIKRSLPKCLEFVSTSSNLKSSWDSCNNRHPSSISKSTCHIPHHGYILCSTSRFPHTCSALLTQLTFDLSTAPNALDLLKSKLKSFMKKKVDKPVEAAKPTETETRMYPLTALS